MKRRDFIKRSVPVSVLPFILGGFTLKAYGRTPRIDIIANSAKETDHVLVLIQLNGGNDGLNTVIPLDQYSALMTARSNIGIAENKVLKLTTKTGLHPALTGLQSLYGSRKLAVVQSVGYPNPNFSHFRATDIWLSASDSDQVLTTGWMGRYLYEEFPDYPNGYPNTATPDPLAIQIGSVISTGLQGPAVSMGMALTSPTSFYQLISGGVDTAPNTPAGHELTFIRQTAQQTQQYATSITTAASKATNFSSLYPAPGTNTLADQLKIVAQLIAGGLKTRIYVVNLGGFDTHSSQVDATAGTDAGNHAILLGKLSAAISAFEGDLKGFGIGHRVIGMTFSEFGRRIKSNASLGTDHGSAAPLFLFGDRVASGIIGANPIIPANATVNDNIPMQYDFRSVYASVLQDWFDVQQNELEAVLLKDFQKLPLIKSGENIPTPQLNSRVPSRNPAQLGLEPNYPNPFNPSTHIQFHSNGDRIQIKVFDTLGREIRTLADGVYSMGEHEVVFDADGLPSGTYYYRMQSGTFQEVKSMILAR
jgi:uncharacterized protein (DUF1501 family)